MFLRPWWLNIIVGLPIYAFIGTVLYLPFEWFWKKMDARHPDEAAGPCAVFWPFVIGIGIPFGLCLAGPIWLGGQFNRRIERRTKAKKDAEKTALIAEKTARIKAKRQGDAKLSMVREALQLESPSIPSDMELVNGLGQVVHPANQADYLQRLTEKIGSLEIELHQKKEQR